MPIQAKKFWAAFVAFAFLCTLLPQQLWAAGWVDLSTPSLTGSQYTGLSFFGDAGIATGSFGNIYTTDGGKTWLTGNLSSTLTLQDVVMTSATDAVAVGGVGIIYKTRNGGKTWTNVETGNSKTLYAVDNYESALFAVGASGVVMRSADSGDTWVDVSFTETRNFYDVDMISNDITWLVGENGMVYEYINGSGWWNMDMSTSYDLQAVSGHGTQVWVAGEGELLATSEHASSSWDQIYFTDRNTANTINDVVFVSATEAYMARSGGCLWHSTDAGESWSDMNGTCDATYTNIAYLATSSGLYATGEEGSKFIQVYDDQAPAVGTVSNGTSVVDTTATFSVSASDDFGISSCILLVNGSSVGLFTLESGNTYVITYAFTNTGSTTLVAQCTDNAGNVTTGSTKTIQVQEDESIIDVMGELIKTACSSGYEVNDPCTAVYYVANDGQRHAFPNEKVYFSWYSDFDDVVTVSSDTMASLTLGKNITYKPGVTMAKFQSVSTVYAIEEGGVLRAVGSESIAASLYGSDWNTHDVDDISDAFYSNYTFGANINSASDYDVDAVLAGTATIDENF